MIRLFRRTLALRNCKIPNLNQRITYKFNTEKQEKPTFAQPWEIPKKAYVELVDALGSAHNCFMIGELLKENLNILTDYQLSFAIRHIWNHELVLDEHFYGVVSPIVKYYVENFDRENNKALIEITKYCGLMEVQDEELWKIINHKINEEKLYRYIELEDLIEVTHALATSQKGTQDFYRHVEGYILKHKLALTEPLKRLALSSLKQAGSQNQVVIALLEGQNVDFQAQQKQIN